MGRKKKTFKRSEMYSSQVVVFCLIEVGGNHKQQCQKVLQLK